MAQIDRLHEQIVRWLFVAMVLFGLLTTSSRNPVWAKDQAEKEFDITRSAVTPQRWQDLSSLLVEYVKTQVETDPQLAKDVRILKISKVAYLLAPMNRPAVLLHAKLKRQQPLPPAKKAVEPKTAINLLLESAGAASSQNNETDTQVTRYLYALGLLIDPTHEDCLFESELLTGQFGPIDWSPLLEDYAQSLTISDGYQRAINGLVVMNINNVEVGQVAKILLTYRSKDSSNEKKDLVVKFAQGVGKHMVLSLEEAARYWRKYSAGLKLQPGLIEISFEDKYTSKDGGSAGAAYAVLIHSFANQFDIDEKFAMTGDISVEGKVLKVGGIFAKVRGAYLDGCTRVSIPKDNVEDLIDQIILNGHEILGQIEIFSVETIQEAIELARVDQAEIYLEVTDLWATLVPLLDSKDWKKSSQVKEILNQVLAKCPNHVSAKLLRDVRYGTLRKHLSLSQSILHVNDIFASYMTSISHDEEPSFKHLTKQTSSTAIRKVIDDLSAAQPLLAPQAKAAHEKLMQVCRTIAKLVRAGKQIEGQKKALSRKQEAINRARTVLARYKAKVNSGSKDTVTTYNSQVDRVNKSVLNYQNQKSKLNERVQEYRELLNKISKQYDDYYAAVQEMVQDQEVLEKLIRGQ